MPEPKTRRVLLCGGHMDGKWVDVPEGDRRVRALKPEAGPLRVVDPAELMRVPFPEVEEYQLEPLPIAIRSAGGGQLWVGACGYGRERDEAILRGILQRDVAEQLLGGR